MARKAVSKEVQAARDAFAKIGEEPSPAPEEVVPKEEEIAPEPTEEPIPAPEEVVPKEEEVPVEEEESGGLDLSGIGGGGKKPEDFKKERKEKKTEAKATEKLTEAEQELEDLRSKYAEAQAKVDEAEALRSEYSTIKKLKEERDAELEELNNRYKESHAPQYDITQDDSYKTALESVRTPINSIGNTFRDADGNERRNLQIPQLSGGASNDDALVAQWAQTFVQSAPEDQEQIVNTLLSALKFDEYAVENDVSLRDRAKYALMQTAAAVPNLTQTVESLQGEVSAKALDSFQARSNTSRSAVRQHLDMTEEERVQRFKNDPDDPVAIATQLVDVLGIRDKIEGTALQTADYLAMIPDNFIAPPLVEGADVSAHRKTLAGAAEFKQKMHEDLFLSDVAREAIPALLQEHRRVADENQKLKTRLAELDESTSLPSGGSSGASSKPSRGSGLKSKWDKIPSEYGV